MEVTSTDSSTIFIAFLVKQSDWDSNLPQIQHGTARFFKAESTDTPAPFCWDSGSWNHSTRVNSFIFDQINGQVKSRKYTAVPIPSFNKTTYALYTAIEGSWVLMDKKLYPNLGKMYYAKTHGYQFIQELSTRFIDYFGFSMKSQEPYAIQVASKAVMLLDAMHRIDADWIFWMDADTTINHEWIDLPLDAYTADVPHDKVWVSTNYKALVTGVFLVRNDVKGRKLVRDWVSIVMSGHISCHGYDQAALEVLMMQRLEGTFNSDTPLGLSCKHESFGGTGCNNRSDFSCDYKFELALTRLGFETDSKGFYGRYSSFSRGCANAYVPEFHVSFETASRPRLHCFYCGRTDRICSQYWDGPLGGTNDHVRSGAVNSWFTNHKMEWYTFSHAQIDFYLHAGYS